jgi:hypothetical protein
MRITFGQWTPDRPGVAGSLVEAKNVIPTLVGYGPMPSAADFSNAATEDLLTCFVGRWMTDTVLFGASPNYLWRYFPTKSVTITGATQANPCVITSNGHGFRTGIQVTISGVGGMTQLNGNTYTITRIDANTFSLNGVNSTAFGAYTSGGTAVTYRYLMDVSRTASAYTLTAQWTFTQFGQKVIAANGQDKLQSWTVGSSSNFADLAAAAPTAQFVTTVRDFVVAGKTSTYPNRLYWSDINDETDWTPGVASQSDTQDIPDGGEIRGITGGEFGIILLERSIVRMSYIGAPLFFQFDNVTTALGCYESRSVVRYGGITYFLSDDGFYMTDGQSVKPIGSERVDRWFFDFCDPDQLDQMSAAVDPINKTVSWGFTDIFANKQLLVYNWSTDKWSHGDTTADYISTIATSGTDLEALSALYPTLDTVPASLDSRIWTGGRLLAGGVSGAKIISFGGSNLTATLQTGDIETQGLETLATLARPIIDGGSCTVAIASRKRLDGNISYASPVAADSDNRVSLRSRGKYHRLSFVPTGNWSSLVGSDLDLVPCGGR